MKNKLLLISALTMSVAACEKTIDMSTPEGKGIYYARMVNEKIHQEYLQCYPLNQQEKSVCTKILADKYLRKNRDDKQYVQAFQYEAEKLGFKNFLNNSNRECEQIEEGPEYEYENNAYLVKCKQDHQYYMQFDYQNKRWSVKNERP